MKIKRKLTAIVIIVILSAFIQPVYANERAEDNESSLERIPLRIGYMANSFSGVDIKDVEVALEVWLKRFVQNTHLDYFPIVITLNSLDEAINVARAGKIDLLVLVSIDFFKIKDQLDFTPLLTGVEDGKSMHEYLLLVHSDSDIHQLEDLKGKRLIVDVGGKGDLPGVWLNTMLLKKGFSEGDLFFKSLTQVKKPSQAVLQVFFNQADACIVTGSAFRTMTELNPQLGKKLITIDTSPGFLRAVICARNDLDQKIIETVRKNATEMHHQPSNEQVLILFKIDNLITLDLTQLESVKEILNEYKRLKSLQKKNHEKTASEQEDNPEE